MVCRYCMYDPGSKGALAYIGLAGEMLRRNMARIRGRTGLNLRPHDGLIHVKNTHHDNT